MNKIFKSGLVLCLLALLPLNSYAVFAKYGIYDGDTYSDVGMLHGTWNAFIQGMSITLSGSGTKTDPYQINDVEDLCYLEDQVNAGNNFKEKYFKLMNDIDLRGKIWYPIGVKSTTYFAGLFDGNDKTISNMSIVVKDADNSDFYSYGLFGYMKGVVKHLNMKNAYVVINRTGDNAAKMLMAGLLCGNLTHDMDVNENIYGAVYECNVQGSIGGGVGNYFESTYVGGIVGTADNPVSIYKCQANVSMTTQDVRYVGGIVGWSSLLDFQGERTNSYHTPCVAYVFDCVANVNILAELRETSMLHCGGICGMSNGTLVACVANGTIECGVDAMYSLMVEPNMIMGGVAGRNGYSIMNCVSTVQLKGGTTVGGLIGRNYNYHGLQVGDVLNSVFCGHIDSPDAEHTHGLVGDQNNDSHAPVNCLFVGTMHGGTNKEPLLPSGSTPNKCYSDRNMYDDGREWSCYTYTDEFGSATDSWFVSEYDCNVGWQSLNTNSNWTYAVNIKDWVVKDGFYPYFEVNENNITTRGYFGDNVIARATDYFDDDLTTARTPSLYHKYAWLGSVPMNVSNHAFRANFVDTPVSLAIKQQPAEGSTMKTATYALTGDLMTVSGDNNAQTATPKDNVAGSMMLTITSYENVSRNICLDVYTRHQWDGKVTKDFDSGDGTESSPYLIHNARQLMKAFTTNESGQYYRLTKDIWFHDNLLTNTGEPKDGAFAWDHKSRRDSLHWKAHLDGNSHLIRGLYSTNAFGLVETMETGASIENTGFVDCLVWSPESEEMGSSTTDRPLAFLSPVVATGVKIRNCLFDGVLYERRQTGAPNLGGLLHNAAPQTDSYLEDCVVAFTTRVKENYEPSHALFAATSGGYMELPKFAERVLVLNNTLAFQKLIPTATNTATSNCHYPQGFLETSKYAPDDPDGKTVDEMTDGTFFTGDGYDKWTAKKGRFPMLKSFAATDYGKLIALPVFTDKDNRFDNMNYLLDFTPGNATWQSTDNTALDIDTDIRVLEPKTINSRVYLVRTLDGAKVITPVTTNESITAGIKFEDPEAKAFCLAHYDDDHNGEVTLGELKNVTLEDFQADMNEDDNDPDDNDGELIELFPEFRYFAAITDLGTSFREKEKLKTLDFSAKITELSDDDFRGNTSMTQFTILNSMTSVSGKAFYNAGLENYSVEPDHTTFTVADGVLYNKDQNQLLSVPGGCKATSITITDKVKTIASNAVYKMSSLDSVFIDAADYDYETVVALADNAFTAADGKTITYFIEDATQDYADTDGDEEESDAPAYAPAFQARRAQKTVTTDGNGLGHLLNKYHESDFWADKPLDRYFKLEVSENSRDADGNYWATMYIGFDTRLPEELTAYIVDKELTQESSQTLVLREISKKVRMLTPVVIRAAKSGTYILYPSKEATRYHNYLMSENLLEGVGRNGKDVNQSDANDGGCLTLGRNASGQVGFFIYKGRATIPAFRAFLTVNKVGTAPALTFVIADDQATAITHHPSPINHQPSPVYDLQGRRVEHPAKGVYISNGRLVIKK